MPQVGEIAVTRATGIVAQLGHPRLDRGIVLGAEGFDALERELVVVVFMQLGDFKLERGEILFQRGDAAGFKLLADALEQQLGAGRVLAVQALATQFFDLRAQGIEVERRASGLQLIFQRAEGGGTACAVSKLRLPGSTTTIKASTPFAVPRPKCSKPASMSTITVSSRSKTICCNKLRNKTLSGQAQPDPPSVTEPIRNSLIPLY